jgi:hypothetical protein
MSTAEHFDTQPHGPEQDPEFVTRHFRTGHGETVVRRVNPPQEVIRDYTPVEGGNAGTWSDTDPEEEAAIVDELLHELDEAFDPVFGFGFDWVQEGESHHQRLVGFMPDSVTKRGDFTNYEITYGDKHYLTTVCTAESMVLESHELPNGQSYTETAAPIGFLLIDGVDAEYDPETKALIRTFTDEDGTDTTEVFGVFDVFVDPGYIEARIAANTETRTATDRPIAAHIGRAALPPVRI